jgi:hypothetical protein
MINNFMILRACCAVHAGLSFRMGPASHCAHSASVVAASAECCTMSTVGYVAGCFWQPLLKTSSKSKSSLPSRNVKGKQNPLHRHSQTQPCIIHFLLPTPSTSLLLLTGELHRTARVLLLPIPSSPLDSPSLHLWCACCSQATMAQAVLLLAVLVLSTSFLTLTFAASDPREGWVDGRVTWFEVQNGDLKTWVLASRERPGWIPASHLLQLQRGSGQLGSCFLLPGGQLPGTHSCHDPRARAHAACAVQGQLSLQLEPDRDWAAGWGPLRC